MTIDFHAYLQTQSFLSHLRRRREYPRIEVVNGREFVVSGPGVARPVRAEQNDMDARLEAMGAAGIDSQVMRLQHVNGVDAFEPSEGLEIAQAANEELAVLFKKSSGRFIPFATVPMRDPEAAAEELERAVVRLGHRGVGLPAWCDGKPLDSPSFEGIFAAAERLGVVAMILPNHPTTIDSAVRPYDWLTGALGMQVDLAICALRLLCSGLMNKYPSVPVVLVNLGGVLPLAMNRLDHFWARMNTGERPLPTSPTESMRRFHLGTASANAPGIRMAVTQFGADRIVFGSDYPSFDFGGAVNSVVTSGIDQQDVEAILHGNAHRLLRLVQ
ncbi:MAG: amidohydrolase family protein [Burkholderiales bacterium]